MWKDKLISYDDKFITYDEAGHPLNYMGTVRYEYGHVQQLKELGITHYFFGIFIPSAGMWGNGDYYDKAFETSADIYGGVQSRTYNDVEAMYSMTYLEVCDAYGPLAWILIG